MVGAGPGGGPRVAVFDGRGLLDGGADPIRLVGDFFAFDPGFHGGVSVMAFNPYLPYLWEGVSASLMIGAGLGGAPQVLTLDGRELMQNPTAELADPQNYRFIGDPNARDGVEFRSSTTLNRAMSYRAGGLPDDEGWIITGIQVA